ncbi:MFS transporter [Gemmatimonas groenlandica]|uniref:MFS transporter n=1 Tax=Gemmatimonas groenlandica TaxID=2732249 RepID=A0A6M4IZC4_9BACT|nr:MFS transporter [Gemmatimonas groenlandica]
MEAPTGSLRGALAALSLSMLLSSLGTSIANVGLPSMAHAFHASFQGVQWIVLAYLLAITTLIVSAGRLGDILGSRRLLLAGLALFTAASVLCGLANTLAQLIAARALQGVGAAVMMALTHAFISETVPPAQTARAMGLLGTMSAMGTAAGPSVGGLLIAWFGWRALFALNVPLGIAALLLAHRYLPARSTEDDRHATAKRQRFDLAGTVLLALTLAAYALAVTIGRGHLGVLNALLLAAAVCGIALLVHVESIVASPLIQLAMFRDRVRRSSLAMNVLVSTVMMSTLVVGPFYLSRSLTLSATSVGFAMSVGPIVTAVIGVPSGRLADAIGAPRTTLLGLLGIALGSLLLAILPANVGLPGYLVPIAIMTAGYGLFQTANNTVVMSGAAAALRGVTSGLLNLSRNLGLITGAAVMGAVFALASRSDDLTRAHAAAVRAGMQGTYAVAALVIVVALTVGARNHVVGAEHV